MTGIQGLTYHLILRLDAFQRTQALFVFIFLHLYTSIGLYAVNLVYTVMCIQKKPDRYD